MHYIFPLMLALLFTACSPSTLQDSPTPNPSISESQPVEVTSTEPVSLPVTFQDTDDNDLKVIDEDSLKGNYTLKRGLFGTQEISEGYLIIEELDVNNYGYYYVTISGDFSPESHTGIFYNQGGKYVQKVIEDSSESEISQGKKKSKMTIIDNISIKLKDELLTLHINSNKKENLSWIRDIDDVEKSEKLKKSLQEAAYEYQKYYLEKCQETAEFCGNSAYTKVNE